MKDIRDIELCQERSGKRIKSIRRELDLDQAEFARRLKVTGSFLSDVESGKQKPSFELLFGLAIFLNVNLPWVFTGEGPIFNTVDKEKIWEFPGVPMEEEDVLDLIQSLEVPIMRHALVEKYLMYRKRYEKFIAKYYQETD